MDLDLKSYITNKRGRFLISTVDLMGFPHPCKEGDCFYETMIEGPDGQLIVARYPDKTKAIEGHNHFIEVFKE
jgi:hypothetical protein